jgi:hypothetical protein
MSKRPSVTAAMVRRKMEESDAAAPDAAESPPPATEGSKPVARTRAGKKFITFPVNEETKTQFDILAAETRTRREELMREALRDLFAKYGKPTGRI